MTPAPARQPKLCILSTGRAGSRYIAKVLTKAGLPCGHEHYYNPTPHHRPAHPAESSWLALPRVESRHFTGVCCTQLRDPRAVISSFMNGQMQTNAAKPYAHFRQINMRGGDWPEPTTDQEWFEHTVRYVLEWNLRCIEQTDRTGGFVYRVEDVDEVIVRKLVELADGSVDWNDAERAVNAVSKRTNKHPSGPDYEWSDLPRIPESSVLEGMAKGWGY